MWCLETWVWFAAVLFLNELPGAWCDVIDWVQKLEGFVSDKLVVKEDHHGGRGVFVRGHVAENETLLSVPLEAMLLGERAANATPCADRIRAFFESMGQPDGGRSHAVFSIMVLLLSLFEETQDRSRQWPHLDDLLGHWNKQEQQRFPLLWPKWALREIEGTTASLVFSIAAGGVEREYREVLQQTCPELARKFPVQTYKKVWALVNSRVLTYPGSRFAKPQAALIPVFDLVNHHLPVPDTPLLSLPEIQSHQAKSLGRFGTEPQMARMPGGLHLWLRRPVDGGDRAVEVTDVYGLQSNEEMLWTSGFTVPWIHNLTCLTRSRLSLKPQELPYASLSRPGFGQQSTWLGSLQPFLNFNLGGCSATRASAGEWLRPVVAFMKAWIAATEASSPLDLKETCRVTVPRQLRPVLQPFASWDDGLEDGWSLGPCKYLRLDGERLVLDFLLGVLDEKLSQMFGDSLREDERVLQTKRGLWRDVATLRRDEKALLQELTAWLARERRRRWSPDRGLEGKDSR